MTTHGLDSRDSLAGKPDSGQLVEPFIVVLTATVRIFFEEKCACSEVLGHPVKMLGTTFDRYWHGLPFRKGNRQLIFKRHKPLN